MKKVVLVALMVVLLISLSAPTVWASSGGCGKVHVVRRGDTLAKIARRYGTSVNCLAKANHIKKRNAIRRGQWICIPKKCVASKPVKVVVKKPVKCGTWYQVRRGDNLFRISLRYSMRMDCVAKVNGICNPDKIYAGTWLWLPCRCDP